MPIRKLHALYESLLYSLFVRNRFLALSWRCHRRPERSFRVGNRQFPICARCTGIFLGALVFPLWMPLHDCGMSLFLLAVVTNAIDGLSQLTGRHESVNSVRLFLGMALSCGAVAAFSQLALTAMPLLLQGAVHA